MAVNVNERSPQQQRWSIRNCCLHGRTHVGSRGRLRPLLGTELTDIGSRRNEGAPLPQDRPAALLKRRRIAELLPLERRGLDV